MPSLSAHGLRPLPIAFSPMIDISQADFLRYHHWRIFIVLALAAGTFLFLFAVHRRHHRHRQNIGLGQFLFCALHLWTGIAILRLLAAASIWHLDHRVGLLRSDFFSLLVRFLLSLLPEMLVLGIFLTLFARLQLRQRCFAPRLAPLAAMAGILLILLFPLVIQPLTDSSRPMKEGDLQRDLQELARRLQITEPSLRVLEASRWSRRCNARVTGIGPTLGIQFYDNLLEQFPRKEVLAIATHEFAHVRLQHLPLATLTVALFLLFGVYLTELIYRTEREAAGPPFHYLLERRDASAILLALYLSVFLLQPLGLHFSRLGEREADRYTLEHYGDHSAIASALGRLYRTNLSPDHLHPLLAFFLSTHPSLRERLAMIEAAKNQREAQQEAGGEFDSLSGLIPPQQQEEGCCGCETGVSPPQQDSVSAEP